MEPFAVISHIGKSYRQNGRGQKRVQALHEVGLTIQKGEFLVLLGPSGCGKSTFLRILAGLDTATHGSIAYTHPFSLKNAGFVFQDFGLLPWLTVRQNVALGLIGREVPVSRRDHDTEAILKQFGLDAFSGRYPRELSGGMKQRVGLARAFVTDPEIIFLDEPFSELDFFTAKILRQELIDLWKRTGATIVMVSHYIDEAVALADRIAVFSDRPGTIKKIIVNDLPRPRDARSKEFFEREDEILSVFEKK